MFTSLAAQNTVTAKMVTLHFEGRAIHVRQGLTVAAALLEAGITSFRDMPVSGAARGPFCMMGVCFDCLMVIDGMANSQACMTEVRDGMRIERQQGPADIGPDNSSAPEPSS